MKRLLLLCGVFAVVAGLGAAVAGADPSGGPPVCTTAGTQLSGTYNTLVVTGNTYVAAGTTLTVRGTLILTPGSCFDAFSLGSVTVGGNVLVGNGALFALGCTPAAIGPGAPCNGQSTNDTVGGSIIADRPLTMYLDGNTIRGSLISIGGGPGLNGEFLNFPVKDNKIGGALSMTGWQGGWIGALRNTVGASVVFSDNSGTDPDSSEVVTNTIGGSLICFGNTPAVQPGDSGGSPNSVRGLKLGQCTAPGI
jgi:hypothetical protein